MGRPLVINSSDLDGSTLIQVEGEIDLSTVPQLERELTPHVEAGRNVVVDLTGVDFMDSTGIGALVRASNRTREAGAELSLACGPGSVRRVLEVSGLDKMIPVYPDALAATRG